MGSCLYHVGANVVSMRKYHSYPFAKSVVIPKAYERNSTSPLLSTTSALISLLVLHICVLIRMLGLSTSVHACTLPTDTGITTPDLERVDSVAGGFLKFLVLRNPHLQFEVLRLVKL